MSEHRSVDVGPSSCLNSVCGGVPSIPSELDQWGWALHPVGTRSVQVALHPVGTRSVEADRPSCRNLLSGDGLFVLFRNAVCGGGLSITCRNSVSVGELSIPCLNSVCGGGLYILSDFGRWSWAPHPVGFRSVEAGSPSCQNSVCEVGLSILSETSLWR